MNSYLPLSLALFQFAAAALAEDLYRFGPMGPRLDKIEVAAILSAVSLGTPPPLALLGWYSQILPSTLYVDVFGAPATTSRRIRRGVVVRSQCTPDGSNLCLTWSTASAEGRYAQVADAQYSEFDNDVNVRTKQERPFRVLGDFSDEELVSLVDYIRTGPSMPRYEGPDYTAIGPSLSNPEPITNVEKRRDGSVLVRMSSDQIGGFLATVVRVEGAWRLTSVAGWVK
jgi:hypothetical protein